jgi:anaerobic magnesium-protoporphyrin IX monomethyl ester cyclase
MPDNGLASLAGSLVRAGHAVKVLDYGTVETVRRLVPDAVHRKLESIWNTASNGSVTFSSAFQLFRASLAQSRALKRTLRAVADDISREIERSAVDFVGFKLWNGDGFSSSVRLAKTIRSRHPKVKVIGGGPQVDWFEEMIFDYTDAFHCLARGEGERTITALAEWAAGRRLLHGIPNILYVAPSGALIKSPVEPVDDLDSLALPVYGSAHYPSMAAGQHLKMITIDESRGCPNDCHFCIHPKKSGGKWRVKTPERLIAEMKSVMAETGAKTFIYAGSNTPAKAASANAQAIIDAGLDIRYGCFGHVRGIKKADFELLKKSGCRAVFYGVESGCQRILDNALNKGTRVEDIRDALKRTKEAGIYTIGSVIYPCPAEDEGSRKETLDLLLDARPDSAPVQFPGLVPGSTWDAEPERFGFKLTMSRRRAMRYGMTYKIKLIYPPRFWKPLPYLLDGRDSRALMAETSKFAAELRAAGISTNIAHDMVLMADKMGMAPDDFHKHAMRIFYTGDAARIKEMVDTINAA